jgi:hypothetical protein
MRTLVAAGAFILVDIIGALAYLAAEKLASRFDPSAGESHLWAFMIAIIAVAAAVGSAFPIFGRGVPWVAARLATQRAA